MEKYLLSYTAASLLPHETQKVAELYLALQDWKRVDTEVLKHNVLQKNAQSTLKREYAEIKKRLSKLTVDELVLYNEGIDKKYITFLACVKTYRLIYEFCSEVLREKVLLFDEQILPSDYSSFIESKQAGAEELGDVSTMTEAKLRQVMFRMLVEAGMVDSVKGMRIIVPTLPRMLINTVIDDDPKWLRAFLMSDADIQDYVEGKE
jgi:hypothetical protein